MGNYLFCSWISRLDRAVLMVTVTKAQEEHQDDTDEAHVYKEYLLPWGKKETIIPWRKYLCLERDEDRALWHSGKASWSSIWTLKQEGEILWLLRIMPLCRHWVWGTNSQDISFPDIIAFPNGLQISLNGDKRRRSRQTAHGHFLGFTSPGWWPQVR